MTCEVEVICIFINITNKTYHWCHQNMSTYNLTCLLSISAHEQSLKTVVLGMQLDCSFSAVHYTSLNVETLEKTNRQTNKEMSNLALSYWMIGGAGEHLSQCSTVLCWARTPSKANARPCSSLRAPVSMSPFWFEKYDWLFPALHAKVSPAFELLYVSVRVINSISILGIRNVFAS